MRDRDNGAFKMRSALRILMPTARAAAQKDDLNDIETGPINGGSPAVAETGLQAPDRAVYLETEKVLLINLSLPKMTAALRRTAVAFAVEDLIAQPLDQVHVVLGPQSRGDVTASSWLVAVVSNAAMEDIIAAYPDTDGAIFPDVMALLVPDALHWSVFRQGPRILVRLPDASGFATTPELLSTLWVAGGSPQIVSSGDDLPPAIRVAARSVLPLAPDAVDMAFNLRTGRFARRGSGLPKGARAVCIILAVAVLGHLMLLGLDVFALDRIAATRAASLRSALEEKGQDSTGDIDDALTRALASGQPATSSDFLPLLTQAFAALAAQTGQVQVKDLRFSLVQNSLTLALEAPDLAALQTAEAAFVEANLEVDSGAATTGNGAAEAVMTLRKVAP